MLIVKQVSLFYSIISFNYLINYLFIYLIGDEDISELGDVILFLTKTAEEKSMKYEENIDKYRELLPNEPQINLPTAPPKVSRNNNNNENQSSSKILPPPSIESKSSPSTTKSSTSTSASLSKERQTQNRETTAAGRSGSGYGGRGRGMGKSKQQSSTTSDELDEEQDDDSNSDDDTEWRKNRNRIKSKKEVEFTTSSLHSNSNNNDISQSSTFWNIHGPPSTALRTATTAGKYVTKTPTEIINEKGIVLDLFMIHLFIHTTNFYI